MASFPPTLRSSRERGFVFAIAVIVGVLVGIGLTLVLRVRAESFEECVAKEMKQQPQVNLLNVQAICSQRHGSR
jgi:hypothetical protein